MKKLFLALSAAGFIQSVPVQADTLMGLYVGVDGWRMDSDGTFGSSATEVEQFTLDSDTKPVFFVALEHPIPVIPNIRIRTNDLTTSGSGTVSDFNYGGQPFDGDVNVEFDIRNIDFTLYYELLDNGTVSLDIGLTGKYVDGEITVEQADLSVTATEAFEGVIPMLYGAAQIAIPATGFSFFGELHGLSAGDSTLMDYQVGAAYEFIDNPAVDMAVRAGYREYSLELEDLDDIHTDWSFKGPFVGLQLHF